MPKTTSPCPYFSSCGGCDFLDLSAENYQNLKKNQISSLFKNADWIWIGGNSRRRINLQIGQKNQLGFFAKKSKNISEIESCFIAENKISQIIPEIKKLLKSSEENLFTQATITSFDSGLDLVFSAKRNLNFTQNQKLINFAQANSLNISCKIDKSLNPIFLSHRNQIFYPEFKLDLDSEIFIQATKQGLLAIIKIIRDFIAQNSQIKNLADIYSGFGAYSFATIDLIKSATAFEGSEKMIELIKKNSLQNGLREKIKSEIRDLFFDPINSRELNKFDLAIINPPRNGASPQISQIAKSSLKNVIYVSCNPESFSRDSRILIDSGFEIKNLIALDQFYATKHLELVAILTKK